MMGEKQTKTDLGKIKIHYNAISSIAAIATMEVNGVLRLHTTTLFGKVLKFFGKDPRGGAVSVDLKENNEVDIGVSVVVEYGQDVPRVANNVQENIRQAIEKMTGLAPANIDVKVKGVEKIKGRAS